MRRSGEPTVATVIGYEVRRGLVAVAAGVDDVVALVAVVVAAAAVVAEQIAGAGSEEGGWGSRHGFGAGESGWRFAVVGFGVVDLADAVAVAVDVDPIQQTERAVSIRESSLLWFHIPYRHLELLGQVAIARGARHGVWWW